MAQPRQVPAGVTTKPLLQSAQVAALEQVMQFLGQSMHCPAPEE